MEAVDPKRPRLHSWTGGESGAADTIEAALHQFQHPTYSPHSTYSNLTGWGDAKPRSQSYGGASGGLGAPGGVRSKMKIEQHYTPYVPLDIGDSQSPSSEHPLSVNAHGMSSPTASDLHAFAAFHAQQSQPDMDAVNSANPSPPSQSISRPPLKPLSTLKGGTFHDSTSYYQTSTDHRNSINTNGVEMGSPATYSGQQNHQPVSTSPMITQGMNVVTTYPPRRKAIRAAQACDACRARKAKCDEGRPSCGFCKESQVICVYREVPPPKQDRTLLQILDRLGRVETLLDTLNSKTETQTPRSDGSPNRASIKPAAIQTPATPTTAPPTNRPNPPGSPPDDDEQLTIPYQHTTAADKLLRWPTIRKLIDPELLKQKTYALDEEQNRGTIRVYGRGEENVSGGDANFEESDCSYPSSTNWNMLYPAAGNEWDGGGGENNRTGDTILDDSNMPDGNGELNPELQDYGVGGLGPNGELRLDMQTVQELLNSYFSNIHILHPILDKATITQSVYRFADLFNALPQGNAQSNGLGLDNDTNGVNTSPRNPRNNSIIGKRKRSDSIPRSLQVSSSTASQRPIPRTVHSALVLLVLALGAVCLHRRPIPGPLPTKARYPDLFMETTSPFGCSTTPGYTDISQYSQQPLAGSGTKPELRNVDVIPGLAYFSQAMDILGLLIGSNELESVQAGLLAGLYWAQMARILDSWKWISWACMGCQILVRTKLKSEKNPHRKDLILRAFWTCLQLESDFLAELDLPPSGISRMEDEMSMPSGIPSQVYSEPAMPDDQLIWMYSLAHIALRKLLNRAHTALYKQDKSHLDSPNSLAIARELDYQLEAWKSHLPAPLRWEANDPPSSDINAARLRAKYYSARYIIHRPFVYHALHGIDVPGGLGNYLNPDSPTLDEQTSERRGELTPNELEMDCRKCLEAAMKSTSAFHKFDPEKSRPIITNVFGTAHAQFGTLLVLQAAYQSRALRGIVSRGVLADLVKKTLPWLRTLAPISPALKRDLAILENALAKLDLP